MYFIPSDFSLFSDTVATRHGPPAWTGGLDRNGGLGERASCGFAAAPMPLVRRQKR